MLKMTKIELETISDTDMHFFIEKGISGGISYICKRHSSINGSNEEKKTIIYFDANNLHGWGINQPLPYGGFDWLNKQEIHELDLDSISENSSIGYFLEVDLEIQVKYMIFIMIIHWLHKNLKLVQIFCENIVLILLINME